MQSKAKLGAIVGDALIGVEDLLELRLVALVPRVGLAHPVQRQTAQLLEAARMLLLKCTPPLEEVGKVLPCMLAGCTTPEAWGATNSGARNAGLEPVQQRRNAHIRVQHIVHPLLCLRILRPRSLFGPCGSRVFHRRGERGGALLGRRRCPVEVRVEAVAIIHGWDRGRRSHGRRWSEVEDCEAALLLVS